MIVATVVGFLAIAVFWMWWICRTGGISRFVFGPPLALPGTELRPLARRNIPRELLEAIPLYTWLGQRGSQDAMASQEGREVNVAGLGTGGYGITPAANEQQLDLEAVVGIQMPEPALINRAGDQGGPAPPFRQGPHGQIVCAICLENFVAGSSQVRELPCGHLFDPACVDPYLLGWNAQCPVCRTSVVVPARQAEGASRGR